MKYTLSFSIIFSVMLLACNRSTTNEQVLQKRIDSLQLELAKTYKPGLGEFMLGIQVHHAKLWFAGQNQNWKLASFEIEEIKEALADIKTYCTERSETKAITMIDQPIDSLGQAIQSKNSTQFKSSYIMLTNACNSCHHATDHEFNVITVPQTPSFTNQDFRQ